MNELTTRYTNEGATSSETGKAWWQREKEGGERQDRIVATMP